MKILAADDEPLALKELTEMIKNVQPDAQLFAFRNSEKLLEFAKEEPCDIAFLDIEMGSVSGISVAKQLKRNNPAINLIFVTGYSDYMADAISLRLSGYILKPVTEEQIKEEFLNLRNPVKREPEHRLCVRCFGTFDAFVDGKSLVFEKQKTKELLAYLIDRRGSAVTSGELRAVLWQNVHTDKNTGSYLNKLKRDLERTLKQAGISDVFSGQWNRYAIKPEQIDCDYYDYLDDKPEGVRAYNGQYMEQYGWAETRDIRFQAAK